MVYRPNKHFLSKFKKLNEKWKKVRGEGNFLKMEIDSTSLQRAVKQYFVNKLGIKGNFLLVIKDMYGKPIASIRFNLRQTESFSPKTRKKMEMASLITSIQHCTGGPSQRTQARKRKKMYPHWKERSKMISVCR